MRPVASRRNSVAEIIQKLIAILIRNQQQIFCQCTILYPIFAFWLSVIVG